MSCGDNTVRCMNERIWNKAATSEAKALKVCIGIHEHAKTGNHACRTVLSSILTFLRTDQNTEQK